MFGEGFRQKQSHRVRRKAANETHFVFPTDMCGRKNTSQLASVRAQRVRAASCKDSFKIVRFWTKSNILLRNDVDDAAGGDAQGGDHRQGHEAEGHEGIDALADT